MSTGASGTIACYGSVSEDELDRIIGGLNNNFALQLPTSSTLSSSERQPEKLSEDTGRAHLISRKILALYDRKDGQLSNCLGRFQAEARELLSSRTSGDITKITPRERTSLQQCLLNILLNRQGVKSSLPSSPSPWAKRTSEDISNSPPKRARSQQNNDHEHHNAIDALPVCSRESVWSDDDPLAASPSHRPSKRSFALSYGASFTTRSVNSSRHSVPSDLFSLYHTEDVSSMSFTTVDSDDRGKPIYGQYSEYGGQTQSFEALHSSQEKISMPIPINLPHRTSQLPATQTMRSFETSWSNDVEQPSHFVIGENATIDVRMNESSAEVLANPKSMLDSRLTNIWPKLPIPGLTEAPLAVMWEMTRAALHCGVNLEEVDLRYEASEAWHEQKMLRSIISKHPLFLGKGLPASCDSLSWKAAMSEFQCKEKAVTLSVDLTYNQSTTGPLYSLHLNPLKLELGHRLSRRFGADRFLEVIIPSPSSSADTQPEIVKKDKSHLIKIVNWLTSERHYFLGRTWVPFFVRSIKGKKASNSSKSPNSFPERVYLFACDGNNFRHSMSPTALPDHEEAATPTVRTKLKLSDLLDWAVGIRQPENCKQPVTKLFSRLALSLSRTWPTVVLERSQIRIRSENLGTAEQVMNDGIGRLSCSLAIKVSKSIGLSDCPSCFQGRLGSAKGMWLVDVTDNGFLDDDWIELYPSQIKWECDFADPHHRTLEVRNWPKELKSASLNQQFIPVLEAQAKEPELMRHVMAAHLQRALKADLAEQTSAMEEPMDLRLWINQSGSLRDSTTFCGYTEFLGGLPDGGAEKIAFFLDSGFSPKRLKYLRELVWKICKRKADILKTRLNITVPCSSYVYMVADFTSTLAEGEVHLSFSTKFQVDGFSDTLLENMDVLVARAPAHLPSDIQRVKVVSRPELRRLKDVIVFSTNGKTPLADKLSGGDYDGDIAWVCWDPEIVNNFENANVVEGPNLVKLGYLRKRTDTFENILSSYKSTSSAIAKNAGNFDRACFKFISDAFLFNLQPSLLGRCTKYKEKLCYHEDSVKSQEAIALSTLLGNLVDQAKQGIEFTEEDWKRLCKEYIKKPLYPAEPEYAKERGSPRKRRNRRAHILDYLKFDVADVVIEDALTQLDQATKADNPLTYDKDLTGFFRVYENYGGKDAVDARGLLQDLRRDIQRLADMWKKKIASDDDGNFRFRETVQDIYQQWLDLQPTAELRSSELAQELFREDSPASPLNRWELLKASATFKFHHNNASTFVWNIAGKQLAFLKAKAVKKKEMPSDTAPVLVIPEMWSVLQPNKRLIKSIAARREIATDSESVAAFEEVWEFDDNGTVIDDA